MKFFFCGLDVWVFIYFFVNKLKNNKDGIGDLIMNYYYINVMLYVWFKINVMLYILKWIMCDLGLKEFYYLICYFLFFFV